MASALNTLDIRRAKPADKAGWLDLWEGYNRFYQRGVEERTTGRLWQALTAGSGAPFAFIAALEGRPVGFAHYYFQPSTSDWHPRCYLQDLFANPDVRGQGVGRALIEAVYAHADQESAAQVYWLTAQDNAPARRLYDRIGRLTPFVKYQR